MTDPAIKIFRPANPLKGKVGPPRPADPGLLARAEAALGDMAGDYLTWVADDLARLQAAADAAAQASDAAARSEALQTVFVLAHDIKGQGGTFDFALVSQVADSLCRYVEKTEARDATDAAIVAAHIAAIGAILTNGIRGDGGEIGRQVVAGLHKAVERKLAQLPPA